MGFKIIDNIKSIGKKEFWKLQELFTIINIWYINKLCLCDIMCLYILYVWRYK